MTASHPTDAAARLRALLDLRAEHRGLLRQVLADTGMSAETRVELVEHLVEEEDEHLTALAAALGLEGAAEPAGPEKAGASGPTPPRFEGVGSLRPPPEWIWSGPGIGSPSRVVGPPDAPAET